MVGIACEGVEVSPQAVDLAQGNLRAVTVEGLGGWGLNECMYIAFLYVRCQELLGRRAVRGGPTVNSGKILMYLEGPGYYTYHVALPGHH